MCRMSTRPEQGSWITRTLVGYCSLIEPARSAAEYAQYWQQKATIFGSKLSLKFILLVNV